MGRSRGGFATKVHMRAERQGKPLVFVLTGGERDEQTAFESLMEHGAVRRVGRGRPRIVCWAIARLLRALNGLQTEARKPACPARARRGRSGRRS